MNSPFLFPPSLSFSLPNCSVLTGYKTFHSISSRQATTHSEPCGLRIEHDNVYHLCYKVQDVGMLLTTSPCIHLLWLSETRHNSCVGDESLTIFRRDAAHRGQTGLGQYVHKGIYTPLSGELTLSLRGWIAWVDLKHFSSSVILVGHVNRNRAMACAWVDDFVEMMDKITESSSNIVLLGDFNIHFLKSQPAWESTISLFGLHELMRCATRITQTTATF